MGTCRWCGREHNGWGDFCSPKCKAEYCKHEGVDEDSYAEDIDGILTLAFLAITFIGKFFLWLFIWPYKIFGRWSKPLGVILTIVYLMILGYLGSKEEKESLSYIKLICTYYI